MAKAKVLDGELARNARETTMIEDRWHVLGDAAPVTEPPVDYDYVKELTRLQFELLKLQEWVRLQSLRLVVLFEGRDAAGKGGVIRRISDALNPRNCRTVALSVRLPQRNAASGISSAMLPSCPPPARSYCSTAAV